MKVVIGGASGIGKAVVGRLAGETLVADRVGGQVDCDVTDRRSLEALAGLVDRLDALVVTAGLSPALAGADAIMTVNLAGSAQVLEAFDGLVGEGTVVVLLASMAGHMGNFGPEVVAALDQPATAPAAALTDDAATAYMMSKLGVIRLVKRKARDYGARGARIVSVSPGVTITPMGEKEIATGDGVAEMASGSAIGRAATAEELASVIAFLCSDQASYVTGVDWLVDGGSLATMGL